MSQPIPTRSEEAAHIAAQMDAYEAISTRLRAETEGMSQQHPHQWAGMNSDQELTLADTLPEAAGKTQVRRRPPTHGGGICTWTPTRQR